MTVGMGNAADALDDATKAITMDPTYAKGFYRKGMAELKLNRPAEAKGSFLEGIRLMPDDKAFREQLDKLSAAGVSGVSSTPSNTTIGNTTCGSTKPIVKPAVKKEDTTIVDNEPVGGVFRGYKKTSDGRTTTFFNNELDETTKALIGDIAPKKLDAPATEAVTPAPAAAGSVWNTAGTFEERIFTPWAKSRLEELFDGIIIDGLPLDSVLSLTKVVISGDAAVTRNRGKTKHVYDFTATCDWKLTLMETSLSSEDFNGTIIMNDITGDKDYDFEVTVDTSKQRVSADATKLINSEIKSGRLPARMIAACNTFYDDFKAK